MNKNRLSKKLQEALNTQMTKEASASQIYLSYGAWASNEGYGGIANFLFRHANEERNHMMKILEFILERGAKVKIEAIPTPSEDPLNIQNCFERTLALNLLDKIRIAGGANASGDALYVFDKDLQTRSNDAILAEDKTALLP